MLKEFAEDLKRQREKLKISLPEISAQTRINETFLSKLESGDFSFQQEIYIRAFIKEYANAVDLDPNEVIGDYEKAKMGEYKSKFAGEKKLAEEQEKPREKITETTGSKDKENVEKADKEKNEVKEGKKEEKPVEKKEKTVSSKEEPAQKKPERKDEPAKEKKITITPDKPPAISEKKSLEKKEVPTIPPPVKKKGAVKFHETGDKVQPSVLRSIGIFFLACLLLVGLYYMGKAIFFDDNGDDGPEIIRQKFDDVVSENERKILGKRTEEEIRDSIRRAEEEARLLAEQNLDTMRLVVNSFRSGSIIVVEDSANIDNPERISFTANQYGVWKATKYFHITSPNTNTFTVELNGKKIDIKGKSVKNYLISRKDLEDSVKVQQQTQ